MARPSRNQLAERKRQKQSANRLKNLEALWHKLERLCWEGSFDEFEAACENCGQRQSGQNPVCVVCGGTFAAWVGDSEPPSEVRSRCDFPLSHEPGAVRALAS